MFVSGLSDLPKSLKGNPCLEYIGFSLNEIGSEGFGALMNMPESVRRTISELFLKGIMADKNALVKGVLRKVAGLEKLERFDFQGNRFEEGEQEPLIHVLCQLGNLQEVSLSSLSCDECSMLLKSPPPQLNAIRLFELSSAAVETALASCKTLQRVMICESEITKEVIKRSLKISLPSCNCLESLKLINCGIDSETACSIIEAAKTCTTLQLLDLSNNVIRSTTEMCRLLQGSSFTDLSLYHNNFNESSIGEFLALSSCQQQQIPKIHLSMEWKDYAEGKLSNKKRIVFEEMFETNY
uniref:NACHT LRR and PYD domain-containing protein n=1 Tax=Amphimedon queenslandica TaxID=400682 RepID=A0A1X7TZ61_AMPQE